MNPGTRKALGAPLVVFALALAARLGFFFSVHGTILEDWHLWDQSDMATYVEQARRIVAGDSLGRDPYRPYHIWQRFAPEERWLGWYPPRTFHQAPGYSYLLAAFMKAGGDWATRVRLFQAFCGALTAALVFLLARRLGARLAGAESGRRAGWIAGIGCSLYGPLIVADLQLLREGPSLTLFMAGMLVLLSASDPAVASDPALAGRPRAGRRRLVAGLLFGLMTLFHEAGQVVLAGATLGVALEAALSASRESGTRSRASSLRLVRTRIGSAARAAAPLVAGGLLALSPWIARNGIVGAPATMLSTRAPIVLAMSNLPEAEKGGSLWDADCWRDDPDPFFRAMDAARGSPLRMLGHLARRNAEDPLGFARNILLKTRAAFTPGETPDNLCYAYMRVATPGIGPLLAFSPGFGWIFAPGLAGVVFVLRRSRRALRDGTPGSSGDLVLAILLLCLMASLCIVHATGRWRLVIVPPLLVFASVAFARLSTLLREETAPAAPSPLLRAVRSPEVLVALLAAALQVQARIHYGPDRPRPADHVVAANLASRSGLYEAAVEDYRRALELGADDPAILAALERTERLARAERPAAP